MTEPVTERTSTRVWIHLADAHVPVIASVQFCGYSFERIAQVLMGDVHPRPVAFFVFDQIEPAQKPLIVECAQLEPIFVFGHELVDLSLPEGQA